MQQGRSRGARSEAESAADRLSARFTPSGVAAENRRTRLVVARARTLRRWQSGGKRLFDAGTSTFLLFLLFPLVAIALGASRGRFRRTPVLGRWAEPVDILQFDVPGPLRGIGLHHLATLANIMRGDLSWVGPRPLTEAEVLPAERAQWRRWEFRPGVLNLWWIRQRANIAFGSEWESETEYARTQSLGGDAGMLARALPGLLCGGAPAATSDTIQILGHRIDNLSMTEALLHIRNHVSSGDPLQISFLNADCVNRAWNNAVYKKVLNESGLTVADGIGLKLAGRILKQPVRQNVNGTDLFPRLCEQMAADGSSLFLLGAKPGVAGGVARWVVEHYPKVRIAGVRDGYFSPTEDPEVVAQISAASADVLLVAFGAPRQDCWIAERLPQLNVSVAMGVGGLFDFYSGRIPRAPQWMREMGLEWLFRFLQEPGRMWKRYLGGNLVFLWRVFRRRLQRGPEPGKGVPCAR